VTGSRHGCRIALVVAGLVLVPGPAAARGPADDATELAVQADAAHEAGRVVEAADFYVRAYRAMTPDEKSALGEVLVVAALDDLHAVFVATSDPAVQRTAAELLDEYERDTGQPAPEGLAAHRAWILPHAESASEPTSVADDPLPRPIADGDEVLDRETRRGPPRDRDRVPPIAIGSGVVAILGGAALVGVGAPLARRAERAREGALADPRYLALQPGDAETIAYVEGWNDYVRHERVRMRAFVGVGAVLLAAGVGVVSYGVVRLVRHRRGGGETARVRPIAGGFRF